MPVIQPTVPAARTELATDQASEETRGELVVLAASSLQDVLPAVARAWRTAGGVPVRFGFDAT